MGALLKRIVKNTMYSILSLIPPYRGGVILTYHSISDEKRFGAVTPKNFARQMALLKKHRFSVVSLDELHALRKVGRIPPKTIAITFDDGYQDNYTHAFPVLQKYGFPAAIFVQTDSIGGDHDTGTERVAMLSEEEVCELSGSGLVTIGSHTVHHPNLTKLSDEEAQQEITEAKTRLEKLLEKPCVHFAYPHGRHNASVEQAVRNAGVAYAYTTHDGYVRTQDDDVKLNRNSVNRTVTLVQFIGAARWGRISLARFGL